MNKVYYTGFYDIGNSNRMFSTSAVVKMDYIVSALCQGGYSVEIVSPSFILEGRYQFNRGGKRRIKKDVDLWLPPSFGMKTRFGKHIGAFFSMIFWALKLLKLKRCDVLILYHTPVFFKPVSIIKKLKGFKLIIEVEEIYTLSFNRDIRGLNKELSFIRKGDGLMLVNDLLADYLGYPKDKTIISYGPYFVNDNYCDDNSFDDNKIHLVYAGSLSTRIMGAQSAVSAAKFLSDKYILHILGFGDKETTENLIEQIKNINTVSACLVVFEGEKRGEEYETFMKKCDIGICSQRLDLDFTKYAFPSKVMSYLGFGLNVVSSPLIALTSSSISEYMTYYYEDTPESLTGAIINAKRLSKNELKGVIRKLNDDFVRDLSDLINT